jgi:hypothetical protein
MALEGRTVPDADWKEEASVERVVDVFSPPALLVRGESSIVLQDYFHLSNPGKESLRPAQ